MTVYIYTHKDGRKASTVHGAWQALRNAIGREEASRLLNEQHPSHHVLASSPCRYEPCRWHR